MKLKQKNVIFVFCLMLYVSMYFLINVYYLNHSLQGVLSKGLLSNTSPSKWIRFWLSVQSYFPGLFMVLAWVSFSRRNKTLYAIFLTLGLVDVYLSFHKAIVIGGITNIILLFGYVFMIVLMSSLPFIYNSCLKKGWRYMILNIAVFMAVAHREIIELLDFWIWSLKNGVKYYELFIYMPVYLVRQIDCLTFDTGIGLEIIRGYADKYGAMFSQKVPDYFWYVRIFLFIAIIGLNILFTFKVEKKTQISNE